MTESTTNRQRNGFGTTMNKYETHITLSSEHDRQLISQVESWVKEEGLKWTHIILDNGIRPSQPMVTFFGKGSLFELHNKIDQVTNQLEQMRAVVVRVKIECDVSTDGTDIEELINDTVKQYFEHHIKLRIDEETEMDRLKELISQNEAKLSRNARRQRQDGSFERFVTQRFFDIELSVAKERMKYFANTVESAGFDILEIEEEFVIYDSHFGLDLGWT